MSLFKKFMKDASKEAGTIIGNANVANMQKATDVSISGMDLFKKAAENKHNVAFSQAKGNLFEYIEAAKFNQNAAKQGEDIKAVVTDAVGRPHDPADIELTKNGNVVRKVQAKFSDSEHAAADSVGMQRQEKYAGMQRLIRKDEHYIDQATGKETTLLKKSRDLAKKRSEVEGNIYQDQYKDVYSNLTDELHHGKVTSGGSTLEEVKSAYNSPQKYAKAFEHKQVMAEMKCTAASMASASFVTTGVISGISNMFQAFSDEKELADALKDVGADAIQSGLRGGATGVISTAIRYKGVKAGSALLSDSTAATVMAGGIVDGGVALYSFAKGDITAEQLKEQLVDTTAKAATTIYYTKAVTAIMGSAVNPIFPIAVYTTASYVISCTREILKNAELNAQEYDRLTAIYQESTKSANEYYQKFSEYVERCEEQQKVMLNEFIDSFNYNISTGENYDQALYAIVRFADKAGIALQHVDFNEFKNAMISNDTFYLN
jgi:hypothetical protein